MNLLNLRPAFTPHLMISVLSSYSVILFTWGIMIICYPDRPSGLKLYLPHTNTYQQDSVKKLYTEKALLDTVARLGKVMYHMRGPQTLAVVKKEVDRLQQHQLTTVIAVSLDDHNTYGDFIRVINFCVIHNIRFYNYLDNTVYMFPYVE